MSLFGPFVSSEENKCCEYRPKQSVYFMSMVLSSETRQTLIGQVFRQEMERQRLAEWEKQRKAELMQHRQREQEKVLILKAKQEHINSDLEKLVNPD